MKRKVVRTADGSKTIQIEEWKEQYHSLHGAIREAYHVFINQGLHQIAMSEIAVLEIGFGTGLNALITLLEADKRNLSIHYTGVEKFPVGPSELNQLNYIEKLKAPTYAEAFLTMHQAPWDSHVSIAKNFSLEKRKEDFYAIRDLEKFELVYFDAFGARVQPELWKAEIFEIMFKAMKPGGILVTYAAKGSVRRAMESVGFTVERLPGPPGKREMLRARKA